jgi:CRISPR-associated protein Cmr3
MRLFIEPSDVWLFRDGRPFDAGSDHRAASFFPPPPSVIQGALRAAHLTARGESMNAYASGQPLTIHEQIGAPNQPPPFQMRGPFIATRNENALTRYLPLPADAVRVQGGFRSLTPVPRAEAFAQTNLPDQVTRLLWQTDADHAAVGMETQIEKENNFAWATEESIRRYLQAADKSAQIIAFADCRTDGDLFERESRYGIQLEDSRTTARGALYETEFIRARAEIGLDVQVDTLSGWQSPTLLKLGGEGRMARAFVLDDAPAEPTRLPARFKLYFATPALFTHGWLAQDWKKFFSGNADFVAAALPRFNARGGFDLFTQNHKPSERYVPAGSVYYFETTRELELIQNNITDAGQTLGLGQVIIGRWTNV